MHLNMTNPRPLAFVALLAFATCSGGCSSPDFAHDLTTPEGAVLSLEDAYRAGDIEAAVRCKDFNEEARMMLGKLETDFSGDKDLVAQTAEVLELGFRAEMKNDGFPDFRGITSTFPKKEKYDGRDDLVELTEFCKHSSGEATTNTLHVYKSPGGWKVITLVDE